MSESKAETEALPVGGTVVMEESFRGGDVLGGKYELIEPLDAGGMGTVWIAINRDLDSKVAVKWIRSDVSERIRPTMADRLLKEARACAKLDHPAVVRITDYGKTKGGDPYIVMELLHGEDLSHVLARRKTITPKKALRSLLPIVHGLAAAHDKGIVHRDIKPDNIFFAQRDGLVQPKLIDFGVAQVEDLADMRTTTAGTLVGSPFYMSPEAISGEETDGHSDVWSFCVVLYESVTGELPFHGESIRQVAHAVCEGHPMPILRYDVGDKNLWKILQSGFDKRAHRRPSARELGQELAEWLLRRGVSDDICGTRLHSAWFDSRKALSGKPFDTKPPSSDDVWSSDPPVDSLEYARPEPTVRSPVPERRHAREEQSYDTPTPESVRVPSPVSDPGVDSEAETEVYESQALKVARMEKERGEIAARRRRDVEKKRRVKTTSRSLGTPPDQEDQEKRVPWLLVIVAFLSVAILALMFWPPASDGETDAAAEPQPTQAGPGSTAKPSAEPKPNAAPGPDTDPAPATEPTSPEPASDPHPAVTTDPVAGGPWPSRSTTTGPSSPPVASSATDPPEPPPTPRCDPPFYIDSKGIQRIKPECL